MADPRDGVEGDDKAPETQRERLRNQSHGLYTVNLGNEGASSRPKPSLSPTTSPVWPKMKRIISLSELEGG